MIATVLVTGASGFIGGHLATALVDAGRAVRALSRSDVDAPVEIVRGDLRAREARRDALRGIDTVFHCAALIEPLPSPADADAVNHLATLELAMDARAAGVRCFVFLSSQAAIGSGGEGLLREDTPCSPTTLYGRTKLAAERALCASELAPMRLCIVRPPLVYGRGERRSFLRLARATASRFFPIVGRGDNRLSFCHVDNLVEALRFVERDESAPRIVHVADRAPVTLVNAVRTIADALGVRAFTPSVPHAAASIAARGMELFASRLARQAPLDRARLDSITADRPLDCGALFGLGFSPPVEFDEGVRETIASYREDGVL